ncbi:MAG: aldo/keto reductase [Planctomycetota bacterium]|jgi:aryl-alcohol dehydrogenase-like predicted oxidoreductase
METRSCGNSDLKLSVLGTGCWAFGGGQYWGDQNQRDVEEIVHRAVELGINYFDTAEAYNDGRSEKSLGQAVKELARGKIIIGSKVSPSNCYRETLIKHCEACSIARDCGMTMPEIAIKWAVANNAINCALVGARNVRELEINAKAVSDPLAKEVVARLNTATNVLKDELGPGFDYYESTANDRTL